MKGNRERETEKQSEGKVDWDRQKKLKKQISYNYVREEYRETNRRWKRSRLK